MRLRSAIQPILRAIIQEPVELFRLISHDFSVSASAVTKRPGQRHLFPIYFTCRNHLEFLRLSLESLCRFHSREAGTVFLFIDAKDPLKAEDVSTLRKEFPLELIFAETRYAMSSEGAELVINELAAFAKVSAKMDDGDYLMKVDSDVLFVRDEVFQALQRDRPEALGVGLRALYPWLGDSYQGGCYFLRRDAVVKLLSSSVTGGALRMARQSSLRRIPEDQTVSLILDEARVSRTFGSYYFSDMTFLKGDSFAPQALKEAVRADKSVSVIHFEGCKHHMSAASELLNFEHAALRSSR